MPNSINQQLHVFISYVRENAKDVQRLYDALTAHGIKAWLDRNEIKPGYRWKDAIREAIRRGDFFIACFSVESTARAKTYMNEELALAIEELRQRPTDRVWFIPVLLSKCDVPERSIGPGETLQDIQYEALYEDWDAGIQRILSVIQPPPPNQIIGNNGAPMVLIPAGEFLMGTSDDQIEALLCQFPNWKREGFADERPQHPVSLDVFYIDVYPVTNAQFEHFVSATGYVAERKWREYYHAQDRAKHPVVDVSWNDANAYCNWAGKRTPTEAEWEKAARGADGRIWPWGVAWDKTKCNSGDGGPGGTTPVGSYPAGASPCGVMDMAGNVWEWCADWYDKNYYAQSPLRNPQGPSGGMRHVLRGGAWFVVPLSLRSACRGGFVPDYRGDYGFRCCSPRFP